VFLKICQGSCWIQRRHADRYSHRKRVVWRAGFEEMAIRCVERRRDISQPHGVGWRTRVILLDPFLLTTH